VQEDLETSLPVITYAGIGSRETPKPICDIMYKTGYTFGTLGLTLRSGNARGADEAFIRGAMESSAQMEIYLPAKGFGAVYHDKSDDRFICDIPLEAFDIAKEFHPGWGRLSEFVKRLMARNVLQVLGMDLKSPADFIICYTPDGGDSGGTGQAIRIANRYDIPVFNLQQKKTILTLKI